MLFSIGLLSACTAKEKKSADVRSDIRASLDKAGLGAVSVDQDRDKGVVTLGGKVPTEAEKNTGRRHCQFLGRWASRGESG